MQPMKANHRICTFILVQQWQPIIFISTEISHTQVDFCFKMVVSKNVIVTDGFIEGSNERSLCEHSYKNLIMYGKRKNMTVCDISPLCPTTRESGYPDTELSPPL